jgi:hypothetical protein
MSHWVIVTQDTLQLEIMSGDEPMRLPATSGFRIVSNDSIQYGVRHTTTGLDR